MNHRKHYDTLINRAKSRILDGYSEGHHVVPRCVGGGNEPENIVRLTAEEHYVAHQLLVFLYPVSRGVLWAASSMSQSNKKQQRPNNKLYGWIRRRLADDTKARFTGFKHSPEARAKMVAYRTGRKLPPFTKEHKKKISEALTGIKRGPPSEERRKYASVTMNAGMLRHWEDVKAGRKPAPQRRAKGYYFCKHTNKWRARIMIGGKTKHLGLFDTQEDAAAAYKAEMPNYQSL